MGRPRELSETEKAKLLAEGYRPVEVWLPDLTDPDVRARAQAEAKRIASADQEEDIMDWIDAIQDMWEGEDQL
ncbi:MAG TPA: antitoxin MazE-like protein [Mesorhizobium sp.]|nr:antitoxin MazE-like protein [Mesorhizobium sp.]